MIFLSFQALCECLSSSGYASLPLSGPHLESLRRLRLNRDGKRRQILALEDHVAKHARRAIEGQEEERFQDELPGLSKLTVHRPCNFLVRVLFWYWCLIIFADDLFSFSGG